MKFKDPVAWADQEIELQADDTSQQFCKFFLEWFTAADEHMAEDDKLIPVAAMRKGLSDTEQAYGFLATEWIGQMLLLAYQHWFHGVMMERDLTIVERRLLEVMAAVKMVELQEGAVQ